MKKLNSSSYAFLLVTLVTFAINFVACNDVNPPLPGEKPAPTPPAETYGYNDPRGLIVLSEGNMGDETGIMQYITPSGEVKDSIYARNNNGHRLGNVSQDIDEYEGEFYIISQNGDSGNPMGTDLSKSNIDGKLIVVDAETMKKTDAFKADELVTDQGYKLGWGAHIAVFDRKHIYIASDPTAAQYNGGASAANISLWRLDRDARKLYSLNYPNGLTPADVNTHKPIVTKVVDGKQRAYLFLKKAGGGLVELSVADNGQELLKKIEFPAQQANLIKYITDYTAGEGNYIWFHVVLDATKLGVDLDELMDQDEILAAKLAKGVDAIARYDVVSGELVFNVISSYSSDSAVTHASCLSAEGNKVYFFGDKTDKYQIYCLNFNTNQAPRAQDPAKAYGEKFYNLQSYDPNTYVGVVYNGLFVHPLTKLLYATSFPAYALWHNNILWCLNTQATPPTVKQHLGYTRFTARYFAPKGTRKPEK